MPGGCLHSRIDYLESARHAREISVLVYRLWSCYMGSGTLLLCWVTCVAGLYCSPRGALPPIEPPPPGGCPGALVLVGCRTGPVDLRGLCSGNCGIVYVFLCVFTSE